MLSSCVASSIITAACVFRLRSIRCVAFTYIHTETRANYWRLKGARPSSSVLDIYRLEGASEARYGAVFFHPDTYKNPPQQIFGKKVGKKVSIDQRIAIKKSRLALGSLGTPENGVSDGW